MTEKMQKSMPDQDAHPGLKGAAMEMYDAFWEDNVMTWAAAVAFYAGLSLAPMLTVLAWIARNTLGEGAKSRIVAGFEKVLGPQAAQPIGDIIESSRGAISQGMGLFDWISVGILVFTATTVFAQLQYGMNAMWDVKVADAAGWWDIVRKRLFSFGMILALLFLLIVSLAVSAGIQAVVGEGAHEEQRWWPVASALTSLLIFTPLFALMYKYLPDVRIQWQDVWIGAGITATLFVIGKFFLGLYLGQETYESSYGASVGSFIALLVWVYYSSVIFFVGAEATQIYARRRGHGIEPVKHAEKAASHPEANEDKQEDQAQAQR